jgi:hypothetical protein
MCYWLDAGIETQFDASQALFLWMSPTYIRIQEGHGSVRVPLAVLV